MSIEVSWLDQTDGIRYWKFGTEWTWEELYEHITPATKQAVAHLQRIDIVFDLSETKTFPQHFLANLRTASKHKADNLGVIVIIGTPFVQALLSSFHLLNTAMLKHYAFAASVEDSLDVIRQHRGKSKAPSA